MSSFKPPSRSGLHNDTLYHVVGGLQNQQLRVEDTDSYPSDITFDFCLLGYKTFLATRGRNDGAARSYCRVRVDGRCQLLDVTLEGDTDTKHAVTAESSPCGSKF